MARQRPHLSQIGERLGIDLLTYSPLVMRHFDNFARRDAPGFTARLVTTFGDVRYLDVGAGTGRYVEALRERGYRADGCEYSAIGRLMARRRRVPVQKFNLATDPPLVPKGNYDLAFSLEVAEHVPPELGDQLVRVLCSYSTVVFTAAPPGQGGTGHINEQPKSYWEELYSARGFFRNSEFERAMLDADGEVGGQYLLDNLMVFTPGSAARAEGAWAGG